MSRPDDSVRPFGGVSPVLALLPEAIRKLSGLRRKPPPSGGRRQLDDFIAMTRGVVIELDAEACCLEGELPPSLSARYFAGGWYTRAVPPIDHLLDAYSTIVGWYLRDGRAHVRVRPIADPIRDREIALGRILQKGVATPRTGRIANVSTQIGRTSVHECIVFGGTVMALSVPRCVQVDSETLAPGLDAFAGLKAENDPAVVHNLHPQIDPTSGNLVTGIIRYTPVYGTEIELFEIDTRGRRSGVRRYYSPEFNAAHAFAFTSSCYLIPDNPLKAPGLRYLLGFSRGMLDAMSDDTSRQLAVHVVPRDPNGRSMVVSLPQPGFIYHVLNSWDDGERIVMDAFVTNLGPLREASQFELDPNSVVWPNLGGVFRFEIDRRTASATSRLLVPGVQRVTFECIDERLRGTRYRWAWFVANDQHETGRSEVLTTDTWTGTTDRWSTDQRVFFRQPRFVPAEGSAPEGAGWLVIPGYTPTDSRLYVFDAHHVAAGPVAVLSANAMLPYTNHGCVG